MGFCNGCELVRLKKKYGDKLIKVKGSWYVRGELPGKGQDDPISLADGTPIRFVAWFMSEGHSMDEDCRL